MSQPCQIDRWPPVATRILAVADDLQGDDESVGLPEYAEKVVAAIGDDRDVVVAMPPEPGISTNLLTLNNQRHARVTI
jgi:hypothetical protein